MKMQTRDQPEHEEAQRPFKFFAVANANLLRGQLIEFKVDSNGKLTSPNLDFIYTTPHLAKMAQGETS